jgi:hypothetical protein
MGDFIAGLIGGLLPDASSPRWYSWGCLISIVLAIVVLTIWVLAA